MSENSSSFSGRCRSFKILKKRFNVGGYSGAGVRGVEGRASYSNFLLFCRVRIVGGF